MRQQRSAQIQLALHGLMHPRFDVLRDDLAQDQLLGEILGADHDVVLATQQPGEKQNCGQAAENRLFDPTESSVREQARAERRESRRPGSAWCPPTQCRGK